MSTTIAPSTVSQAPATVRPSAPKSTFSVAPMTPTIGAEIGDIDLRSELDDDTIMALRQALVTHKLLVFRDQDITPAQHVALARRFGELEIHPVFPHHEDHPELVLLGGNSELRGTENIYHTDVSWREIPSMGSMLRCVVCPPNGGDTIWVNMVEAYERLPEYRKKQIEGLYAVHDILPAFGSRMTPQEREQARKKFAPATHPVVRTHPESGEKILYVNSAFTTHFANFLQLHDVRGGFEFHDEQQDLMNYLLRQAMIPEYQVRLRWRPNTIAFWDNRSTNHYAIQDYFPQVRRMMRATVIGERPE